MIINPQKAFSRFSIFVTGFVLFWIGVLISLLGIAPPLASRWLWKTGIFLICLGILLSYLRWRRRRLWWIHRQLRWAFISSTLYPLILGFFLVLTLILILAGIKSIEVQEPLFHRWLDEALAGAETTCTINKRGRMSCGSCEPSLNPYLIASNKERHPFDLDSFASWRGSCPKPSPDALFGVIQRENDRLTWGWVSRTILSKTLKEAHPSIHSIELIVRQKEQNPEDEVGVSATEPTHNHSQEVIRTSPETKKLYQGHQSSGIDKLEINNIISLGDFIHKDAFPEESDLIIFTYGISDLLHLYFSPEIFTSPNYRVLIIAFFVLTAVLGVVATGFIVQGFWVGRRVGRAVSKIETAMVSIAQGRFPVQIDIHRSDQLGNLARLVESTSLSLADLFEEKLAHERLVKEVEIAQNVQRRLFPATVPSWPNLDVSVWIKPARQLSGDYYDFFQRAGLYGMVVADVVGKGLPASLLTANVHAILHFAHYYLKAAEDISAMFEIINRHLIEHSDPNQYVTMFYAAFYPESCRIHYAGAGHPPAILISNNKTELLESTGTVLGILPETCWQIKNKSFPPNSWLVLYTDGVLESTNPAGEEYGLERLVQCVHRYSATSPSAFQLVQGIMDDIQKFSRTDITQDDIVIMVFHHPR